MFSLGAMNARDQAEGIVVFRDKWALELLEIEEKEDFWAKLGAIRGLWRDLWCIGEDFNVDYKDVVKDEILGFFGDFYESSCFERSLNATFVVLVPKKWEIKELKDFRPISLVGGLYKLLATVLINRLKMVVDSSVLDFSMLLWRETNLRCSFDS
ncbi:hypothetical protein CK203_075352 [Vitis vinifera]|uniref:Reverse transcriptase domain-containing protein n=1 Tax=Vitis vinifera TaxID=29760 RepID=A0A438BXG2_VITVI|nr:hypothetical protein CK203_075352 [Vitis vinifera]